MVAVWYTLYKDLFSVDAVPTGFSRRNYVCSSQVIDALIFSPVLLLHMDVLFTARSIHVSLSMTPFVLLTTIDNIGQRH